MDLNLAAWLVVLLALAAANLPFINERLFGLVTLPSRKPAGERRTKPFPVRLIELIVLYFVVGFIARLLESRIGSVAVQTWEFHAVTGCLFLVLAFPGFVMRYLYKPRR